MRLDFGCGPNKREGFTGVDSRQFDGKVDIVLDVVQLKPGVEEWRTMLRPKTDGYELFEKWPWDDASVEEANASHFFEHLTRVERVFFLNELYRVLVPRGKFQIIVPHWASCRAYGDLTHEWPAISEFHFYYLSKEWRSVNAPHDDFIKCDFEATWGYSFHQMLMVRNQEFQQFAMQFYKEACQDTIATLTKRD